MAEYQEARREHRALTAAVEKKALVWMARAAAAVDQCRPPDGARPAGVRGGRRLLLAVPAGSRLPARRERLPGAQLARRQPRRHGRARAAEAAAALRLLRRPHGRRARGALPAARARALVAHHARGGDRAARRLPLPDHQHGLRDARARRLQDLVRPRGRHRDADPARARQPRGAALAADEIADRSVLLFDVFGLAATVAVAFTALRSTAQVGKRLYDLERL